jgi:hypothetical protein
MFTIDTRNHSNITTKEHRVHSRRQQQTVATEHITDSSWYSERRRHPERRRTRLPDYLGSDRRRKSDRRTPKLLSAKDGKPEAIENRKGRIIDTAI